MKNRLSSYLETSFPALEPSQDQIYRLESLAGRSIAVRRSRQVWGTLATIFACVPALIYQNPIRAMRTYNAIADQGLNQVGRTLRYDSAGPPVVIWGQEGRLLAQMGSREVLMAPEAVYKYNGDGKGVVREPRKARTTTPPKSTPVAAVEHPWLAVLEGKWDIEDALTIGGKVIRITAPVKHDWRSIVDIDPESSRVVHSRTETFDGKRWVLDTETDIFNASEAPPEMFDPSQLGKKPLGSPIEKRRG